MTQPLFWLVSFILTSELVVGSRGSGSRDKNKPEGTGNSRRFRSISDLSDYSYNRSDPKKYADDVLNRLHYKKSDLEKGLVYIPQIDRQTSNESLGDLLEDPGSPTLKVRGTHDNCNARLGFVWNDRKAVNLPPNKVIKWETYCNSADGNPDDGNEEEQKQKSDSSTLKKKKTDKQRRCSESDHKSSSGH